MAHTLWTTSYVCMFTILGLGYSRFLYAGDADDWAKSKIFLYTDFFNSRVFYTLLVMGVVVLPAFMIPIHMWTVEGGYDGKYRKKLISHIIFSIFRAVIISSLCYVIYVELIASSAMRVYLSEGVFGRYAPLMGLIVANFCFSLIVIGQYIALPATATATVSQSPSNNSRKKA